MIQIHSIQLFSVVMDGDSPTKIPLIHTPSPTRRRMLLFIVAAVLLGVSIVATSSLLFTGISANPIGIRGVDWEKEESIDAAVGVVAADNGVCSEIGATALRKGGHAVDAAVATAICLGIESPASSGIGGGAFMVVRSADSGEALAFDSRETAPLASSQNMYATNSENKSKGALSAGVPGELAGLHAAWSKYGRLPWKSLFEPSIALARDGFEVSPYLALKIEDKRERVLNDVGLTELFAPNRTLLVAGDTCYNKRLADSLEAISIEGPSAFYNGSVGEKFVEDVKRGGGIITMEDLRSYEVVVTKALVADVMGLTLLGMPPPSSGTVGIAMIMNILRSYGSSDAIKGGLGAHRFIEALKFMFGMRMNIGDPNFVDDSKYVSDMVSGSFGEKIAERIFDNTTFESSYYMHRWKQIKDHGTSHFCIVDGDRNAVSMTSTVNYIFGSGVLSTSTGIVVNNEMDDFSIPTEKSEDSLPPSPANFIQPKKRPLSSMTPLIVVKDGQLVGVVGGSGGLCIIPGVAQVFLNHFILGMDALTAVRHPRIYHELIPNEVKYENLTAIDGEQIEVSKEIRDFLEERGHELISNSGCSICQLVVHDLQNALLPWKNVVHGMLTAVCDPRKGGTPARELSRNRSIN